MTVTVERTVENSVSIYEVQCWWFALAYCVFLLTAVLYVKWYARWYIRRRNHYGG